METGPMHSSGGLGYWCALPWLQGLTTEENTAVGAVTSIRPGVCRSPAGEAGAFSSGRLLPPDRRRPDQDSHLRKRKPAGPGVFHLRKRDCPKPDPPGL